MSPRTKTLGEIAEAKLRLAIGDVERTLGGMTLLDESASARLRALDELTGAWRRVVASIDLGPEPAWRDCPQCRGPIRRQATRCVHCWAQSAPSE